MMIRARTRTCPTTGLRVRDRATDDSWLLVEQEIDFGWYAPRVRLDVPPNWPPTAASVFAR
jgi:hypothetical protein